MFISYPKYSAQVRPRQCACGGVVLEGAARRSWWIAVSSRTDPGLWGAVGNFFCHQWSFEFELRGAMGWGLYWQSCEGALDHVAENVKPITIGDVLVWSCAKKLLTRGSLRKRSCSEWGRWDFGETWERIVGKRRLKTFHRKKWMLLNKLGMGMDRGHTFEGISESQMWESGEKRGIVKRGLGFFGIILNTGAESDVDANTRGLEMNRKARNKWHYYNYWQKIPKGVEILDQSERAHIQRKW